MNRRCHLKIFLGLWHSGQGNHLCNFGRGFLCDYLNLVLRFQEMSLKVFLI